MFQAVYRTAVGPVIEYMGRDRVANRNRSLRLSAIERPITIDFDRWGIPHIRATTRHDLFFGQGFVHAQDRLWQMEVNRLVAKGEMASILGEPALPLDRMSRTLGFRRRSRSTWDRLPAQMRLDFEAYAAGINGYLATIESEKLPLEFRLLRYRPKTWDPLDSVTFGLLQGWGLSTGWAHALSRSTLIASLGETLFAEIDPTYPTENPVTLPEPLSPDLIKRLDASTMVIREAAETLLGRQVLPPHGGMDGTGMGSNAWVIGAKRSASGHPILANDTHLVVNSPGIWYYNHLLLDPDQKNDRLSPEIGNSRRFHATGVVIPGSPGVVIGHNESIAWGITVAYTDTQDLYVERLHPTDDQLVETDGGWESIEVVDEVIEVKGETAHTEKVRMTRHGPILTRFFPEEVLSATLVSGRDGRYRHELSLSSAALQPDSFAFEGLLQIAEAADWTRFKAAVDRVDFPSLNIVYADTAGNIGYALTGKIPIRKAGDGRTILPGWTTDYEWVGFIPKDEMPFELNPARGYIVTCNHKITEETYPHHLGHCWMNGYRAKRLEMLLAEKESVSVTDCQAWQLDLYSIPGMQLVDLLRDLETDDRDASISLGFLSAWDGFLTLDSQGGAIYKILLRQLAAQILSPALQEAEIDRLLGKGDHPLFSTNSELYGYWPSIIIRLLSTDDNAWIPGGVGRNALLVNALKETTLKCRAYLGENQNDWRWGKLHQISFVHGFNANPLLGPIFNLGPYPLAGDTDTVCQTAAFPIGVEAEQYAANGFAPAFRQVVDLGDLSNGVAMTVPGQSGQLKDPHHADLVEPWLKGEYYAQLWEWPEVKKEARGQLTLNPSS